MLKIILNNGEKVDCGKRHRLTVTDPIFKLFFCHLTPHWMFFLWLMTLARITQHTQTLALVVVVIVVVVVIALE